MSDLSLRNPGDAVVSGAELHKFDLRGLPAPAPMRRALAAADALAAGDAVRVLTVLPTSCWRRWRCTASRMSSRRSRQLARASLACIRPTMARLAIEQGSALAVPRRFLPSILLWRALAGVLLCVDGESLLRSRQDPAALALTHAFTPGVLGNAMA